MRNKARNPGPSWGYRFLQWAVKWVPDGIFRFGLRVGAVVGWSFMPDARKHSRDYWKVLTGKQMSLRQQWQHFGDFAETLVVKLSLVHGHRPAFHMVNNGFEEEFMALCRSKEPALFGSFHFGEADLMGSVLSEFDRRIAMIRLRVGNSEDIRAIEKTFGDAVDFIWINQPEEMLFALKSAMENGCSIAMHCDRVQYGSRRESFEFLGKERWFPITIYHLAIMFQRPVVFAFAARRDERGSIPVVATPVFRPLASKVDSLCLAKNHFQKVLNTLEELMREDPFLWFNFEPLNEEVRQ